MVPFATLNGTGSPPKKVKVWNICPSPPAIVDTQQAKSHAYFRGRHLHGTAIPIPEGYTGAVLRITSEPVQQAQAQSRQHTEDEQEDDDDDEDDQMKVDTRIAEKMATFDEVVVWGHASEVDARQDAVIRGMREWIGFAEAMHTHEEENGTESKG